MFAFGMPGRLEPPLDDTANRLVVDDDEARPRPQRLDHRRVPGHQLGSLARPRREAEQDPVDRSVERRHQARRLQPRLHRHGRRRSRSGPPGSSRSVRRWSGASGTNTRYKDPPAIGFSLSAAFMRPARVERAAVDANFASTGPLETHPTCRFAQHPNTPTHRDGNKAGPARAPLFGATRRLAAGCDWKPGDTAAGAWPVADYRRCRGKLTPLTQRAMAAAADQVPSGTRCVAVAAFADLSSRSPPTRRASPPGRSPPPPRRC